MSSQTQWDKIVDMMELHSPSLLQFFVFNATTDLATPYCWKMVSAAAIICPLKMTDAAFQHTGEENVLTNFQGTASTVFITRWLSFALLSVLGFFFLPCFLDCCAISFIILFCQRQGATKQQSSVDESRSVWKVLHEVLLLAMFLCPAMSLLASPEKT